MILEVEGVTKSFGGIQALNDCSISVERGTITGLIGPNGAGKTTLFNVITGFIETDSGRVTLDGEDITDLEPHEVTDKGLFRSFQLTRELGEMTVLENIMLTRKLEAGESLFGVWLTPGKARVAEKRVKEQALEVLEYLEMREKRDELAKNLPGGEKKLLDVGRMMMVRPKMVLLDEPGAGVPPSVQNKLTKYFEDLSGNEGVTFLVVEHDMNIIMDLCDPIVVLVDGSKLTEGTPEEIKNSEEVIEAYLGSEGD